MFYTPSTEVSSVMTRSNVQTRVIPFKSKMYSMVVRPIGNSPMGKRFWETSIPPGSVGSTQLTMSVFRNSKSSEGQFSMAAVYTYKRDKWINWDHAGVYFCAFHDLKRNGTRCFSFNLRLMYISLQAVMTVMVGSYFFPNTTTNFWPLLHIISSLWRCTTYHMHWQC